MLLDAFAILVMLGILSVLIIVHEFGHFLVARFFGFQTPVFGFGLPFGPSWVVGHRWGTEFRIHACLLGGYVAIPELGDESNAKEEHYGVPLKPFKKFPIWQRALVAFAGVGFNIMFAWLVMFTMLTSLGEPTQSTVVKQLPPENPIAAKAGVKVGDKVISVNSTAVQSPDDVVHYLSTKPNTAVVLHVERDGQPVDIPVTTNGDGKVGMALITKGAIHYKKIDGNVIDIAGMSTQRLTTLTGNMVEALGMMVGGLFKPHAHVAGGPPSLGVEDLHGVLAVIKIGADIAKQDWSQLYLFTIMISMDLAIINLVPWPALDGGHLAFMTFEALRGKPMEERAQGEIVKWGFLSLLFLMAVIMFNDVKALVTGKLDFKPMKDDVKDSVPADKRPGGAPTTPNKSSTSPNTSTTPAAASTPTPTSSNQPTTEGSGKAASDSGTASTGKAGKVDQATSSGTTSEPVAKDAVPNSKH